MSRSGESKFVYVVFIGATADALWSALTDARQMGKYWFGMRILTEWRAGAEWKMLFPDGSLAGTGEILEADRPKRIRLTWRNEYRPELKAEGFAVCTIGIEPMGAAVKLTVTHAIEGADSKFIRAVSEGWPKILSNLKSFLETGQIVLLEAGHTHSVSALRA